MPKTHIVKLGDTLGRLSIKYYGTFPKWVKIKDANPQILGRGFAVDGSPLIFPGDILIIPDDIAKPKTPPLKIEPNSEDEVTVVINGNRFSFFQDFALTQNIDTFDGFTFSAPFDPTNVIYRESFRPFSYKDIQVFYGSEIWFSGILLAPQSQSSPQSKAVSLTGYPKCGVINDVMLPISKYPIEFNNQTLQQIATRLISDFSVSATFQGSPGNPFKKTALEPDKNILAFLIELADQRGLLISNTPEGNLLFWQANTGAVSATFKEGETPLISCTPTFNQQDFYSHVTGIMPAKSGVASQKYTVINTYLVQKRVIRPYNYIVSDAEAQDLQNSVKHKASRMFASACSYQITVQGHRNRLRQLYKKNILK